MSYVPSPFPSVLWEFHGAVISRKIYASSNVVGSQTERYNFMSICILCSDPIFVILSAVTNFLLATSPLDFGGSISGQNFTHGVVPTLD